MFNNQRLIFTFFSTEYFILLVFKLLVSKRGCAMEQLLFGTVCYLFLFILVLLSNKSHWRHDFNFESKILNICNKNLNSPQDEYMATEPEGDRRDQEEVGGDADAGAQQVCKIYMHFIQHRLHKWTLLFESKEMVVIFFGCS